jgi:Ca2+-binding EF-hand superfamily protein
VEDTFRLFEKNGRGILDLDDLKYGFGVVSIFPSEYNMGLFMKRYDLQKKGFISFADFYDIVVPFEKYIREDVEKRIPKTNCAEITLSRQVKYSLNKLFKFLIDFENKANIEKKSLNVNFKEVFNELDTEKQGFFTFENFLDYLNEYNLIEENINPDLLYIRLDKNRNGIIDLEEFAQEMTQL